MNKRGAYEKNSFTSLCVDGYIDSTSIHQYAGRNYYIFFPGAVPRGGIAETAE